MLALVIVDTCCVALLAVLVVGLLRSHADILRALHSLGAGVGDPAGDAEHHEHDPHTENPAVPGARRQTPVTMGPTLSAGRSTTSSHDVSGVTPEGDAMAVSPSTGGGSTLLAFLSSGCTTCSEIWRSLGSAEAQGLPADVRVVVVTKGPELEIAAEVRRKAPEGVPVVMSTSAWSDYEVPGSPFFVLVDGRAGRRVGEGIANHLAQVADLVRRARVDEEPPGVERRAPAGGEGGGTGGGAPVVVPGGPDGLDGLHGKAREARNDQILAAAGILPGDPSLYPSRLDDVFAGTAERDRPAPAGSSTPRR